MFGLGAGEVFLICVLGLIFVGPKKIPELARSLGKGVRAFQGAKDEVVEEFRRIEGGEDPDGRDGEGKRQATEEKVNSDREGNL